MVRLRFWDERRPEEATGPVASPDSLPTECTSSQSTAGRWDEHEGSGPGAEPPRPGTKPGPSSMKNISMLPLPLTSTRPLGVTLIP